jgi:hypothetical protein
VVFGCAASTSRTYVFALSAQQGVVLSIADFPTICFPTRVHKLTLFLTLEGWRPSFSTRVRCSANPAQVALALPVLTRAGIGLSEACCLNPDSHFGYLVKSVQSVILTIALDLLSVSDRLPQNGSYLVDLRWGGGTSVVLRSWLTYRYCLIGKWRVIITGEGCWPGVPVTV